MRDVERYNYTWHRHHQTSSRQQIMQNTPRKKHCYECLRRSLVCDSTRPSCTRCTTSGTPCPGYDHPPPRPLRWLAPGRVTSRRRKKKQLADAEVELVAVIPRFKMRTDACAVVQAVEYCKYHLIADGFTSTNHGNRQWLRIP